MPIDASADPLYVLVWLASAIAAGTLAGLALWYVPLYAYRIARNLYRAHRASR